MSIKTQLKNIEKEFNSDKKMSEERISKLVDKERILKEQLFKELVPMMDITDTNKTTFYSLAVSEYMDKIKKRCEEFFARYYVEESTFKGHDILIRNLNLDLEYMFSMGLWLLKMYNMYEGVETSINYHFANLFVKYDEKGHKEVLAHCVRKYNKKKDRPYTDKEFAALTKRGNTNAKKFFDKYWKENKI